jgi:oligopeptide/dipeptide ABC transporter ATP-binding protein
MNGEPLDPTGPGGPGPHPVIQATNLTKVYRIGNALRRSQRQTLTAIDRVNLDVRSSETVGLIGESGSGKSTLGRALLRLLPVDSGRVCFQGQDITSLQGEDLRQLRRRMNLIFQNPHSAVDARQHVEAIVREPLDAFRVGTSVERRRRVADLLDMVGLSAGSSQRYPNEMSGGQLQRVVIARALATQPDFLVADEPTASLDMSIRAQITNLMLDLKDRFNLSMLFISHDLRTISHVSDQIAVMYLGRVVERGPARLIERAPLHPYTINLIDALPRLGEQPDTSAVARLNLSSAPVRGAGCRYADRCLAATDVCRSEDPELEEKTPGHWVACHHVIGQRSGIGSSSAAAPPELLRVSSEQASSQ